jgi:hypothetical protein
LPLLQIPVAELAAFLVNRYATGGKCLLATDAREMVEFVEGYPYYVQKLAMLHFDMESTDFQMIFLSLTNHQKNLIRSIAKHRPANIHGQGFLAANRIGS